MASKMEAIVLTGLGGPEVLQMRQVPLSWPRGTRDVLVRLKASGVNPADAFFRALGPYVQGDGPCVLGHDGAGIVEATGRDVTHVHVGDAVCFCNGGIGGEPGTYAEFAIVPEAQLVRVPASVSFVEAAALPLVLITAWEALYERAGLRPGERVLIHAGAGGTGHVAVQLAKLRDAHVAATVSTDAKAAFVSELGADLPIVYRRDDFVKKALDWAEGRGLDVALDNIGAETMQQTYRAMAPYGRVVTLMGTPGDDADGTAYNRNLTLHNVMMLTPMWLGLQDRLTAQAVIVARGMELMASDRLRVHIDRTFPLADAAAAHAWIATPGRSGKVVLTHDD